MFLILVKWHERMKTFGAIGKAGQKSGCDSLNTLCQHAPPGIWEK